MSQGVTVECPFHFARCTARPRRIDLGEQIQVAQAEHLALLAIAPASANSYYDRRPSWMSWRSARPGSR